MNTKKSQQESLVLTLLESAAMVERRLDHALSSIRGISFSEYRLLRSLSMAHGGAATRADLAESVGLTPSAVTRAIKPLEKLGYVVTRKSERDARRSLATLTKAGIELQADAQGVFQDVVSDLPMSTLKLQDLTNFRDGLAKRHYR